MGQVKNKYYSRTKTPHQIIREHVDMFGFLQKNVNALDILIEDAKITLQTWGAQAPSFMLCNSKLTMQLTMTPEKTNFITQGYDGLRRLKSGPMLDSYRGLAIIHSRQYSLETGAPPRDLLRRRVRVAEYYRIPWQQAIGNGDRVMLDLYDESKDTFFTVSWKELLHHAALDEADVAKFNSLGQGALATDVTFQAAMYANPATQRDLTYVVRPRTDRQAGRQANNQNVGNTTEQERHATWVGEVGAHSTDNMGLVLTTNTMQMVRSPANDQRTREEVRSFYKASGWFNGTGLMEGFYFCPIYVRTMQGVYFQRLPGIQTIDLYTNPNVAFVAQPIGVQRAIFKALYSGYSVRRPNIPGQDYTVNRVMYGMRPNLHVGRMVFVDRRPDAMRFKHVAAHVMAQCVVTRQLAIRLMQQADTIEKNAAGNVPPESLGIIRAIADMFGMEDEARCLQGSYGLYTSVLAYMAAAVLHPDMELRAYCTRKLKENVSLDVGDMGDVLAIWLKVFINATPLPRQGSESPTFDPFDQGLVLARHFERVKNPELDANDELDAGLRDRLPVMYLGEMPSPEAVRAQTDRVCAAAFPNAAGGVADEVERLQAIELGDWKDRPDEYAMHRDVKSACFKHRSAYVFPDGR